ncbi:hypothetical protein [Bacillus sp. JCM 19034]|uniref:YqgU-like beta propeller domain-containing protein n=1 Tax=Bacillus sp. JCM 19034 TaxID=1481928 RepID=UPI000783A368|nr:hypothetical protein [Bacillus sp. JCM 19034]
MKKFLFVLSIIILLCACSFSDLEAQPSPTRTNEMNDDKELPESIFESTTIRPFDTIASSFIEVVGWFSDEEILYLEEEDERSHLYKYHLYNGDSELLFETDGWIIDVSINADHSFLAIQTYSTDNKATLLVMTEEGQVKRVIEDLGEEYAVYWNPYEREAMILISFLPDWKFVAYMVDMSEDSIVELDLPYPYVQWLSSTTFAYLHWDEFEPSYHAPLVVYDLKTHSKKDWKDDVIAFASLGNQLSFTVTVSSPDELYSTYTFYKGQNRYRTIEMPILNTYSEQWWVPFYTYDGKNDFFYYLRPKYSSDFFSYEDGYEFIAYSIEDDSEKKIITLEQHVPLSISPKGDAVLIGNRFEQIYDVDQGKLIDLFEFE